jgi:hypothetical protein
MIYGKMGLPGHKKNKLFLFKGSSDGDLENDDVFAHKNLPYYTTSQFNSVMG